MRLLIIGSSSLGNAYILENDKEVLLIECGVRFKKIQEALRHNLRKVAGCIVTHEHGDHAKSIRDVMVKGIDVYATKGTWDALNIPFNYRSQIIKSESKYKIGGFTVMPFDVQHDVAEPVGFLIHHPECGNVLFITDSYYCKYNFQGIELHNIIIEANYCQSILDAKVMSGTNPKFLRDRVIQSHMSLKTCKELLAANDLSATNKIVLIHLSDGNSDAKKFKREVEEQTGKQVYIADAGMVIENFNSTPF